MSLRSHLMPKSKDSTAQSSKNQPNINLDPTKIPTKKKTTPTLQGSANPQGEQKMIVIGHCGN
jgi:hypothetical protein